MELDKLNNDTDPARVSLRVRKIGVQSIQETVNSIEHVRVPVIASMHGFVIGGGIDMSSTCDIRYCAKGTKFSIKEVDIGVAADVGTI